MRLVFTVVTSQMLSNRIKAVLAEETIYLDVAIANVLGGFLSDQRVILLTQMVLTNLYAYI